MICDWSVTASDSRMFCSRNLIAYSSLLTTEPSATPPWPVYVVFACPDWLLFG